MKGIIFNLKLPGFESIRKLFMRPITTMQDVKIMKAGEIIFNEGEVSDHFYLLKKGSVIFYKKKESGEIITIDTLEAEQLFGEKAILGDNIHTATSRCLTDCVIAIAERENLTALIKSSADFTLSLLQTLAKRIKISEQVLFENIQVHEKRANKKLSNTIQL